MPQMETSYRLYRFAFWGILGVILLYAAYYTWYIFSQVPPGPGYRQAYIAAIIKQFLLYSIILGLEMLIYWRLRWRLYRRAWVRAHIMLLWTSTILLPLVLIFFYFVIVRHMTPIGMVRVSEVLPVIRNIIFWAGIGIGHLFFIGTIVKSFSKQEQPPDDASDTTNILDEFNQ